MRMECYRRVKHMLLLLAENANQPKKQLVLPPND